MGAIVPGARVTITNERTGGTDRLPPIHRAIIRFPLFCRSNLHHDGRGGRVQKFSSLHNRLASNNTVEINAKLTIGQATQTVTVTDTADVLETSSLRPLKPK